MGQGEQGARVEWVEGREVRTTTGGEHARAELPSQVTTALSVDWITCRVGLAIIPCPPALLPIGCQVWLELGS